MEDLRLGAIEDVVLSQDKRGVSALRPHLPQDFCEEAARLLLETRGTALITTGFYILNARNPETDGPPGAIAVGRALERMGRSVYYVVDDPSIEIMRSLTGADSVLHFPITDADASRRCAAGLLERYRPGLLISVERCGRTSAGTYLNMRGLDISAHTAKVDSLFDGGVPSLGIGDGGNEIGMGNLAALIPTCPGLSDQPCVTRVTQLVIASVSNWGGYGVVAALSRAVGRDLLPDVEEERGVIERCISLGAVDGTTGQRTPTVDGFDLEANLAILESLHGLVRRR